MIAQHRSWITDVNKIQFFCQNGYLDVFSCVFPPLNAYATAINFAGQCDVIGLDEEDGICARTPLGTDFFGIEVSLEGKTLILRRLSRLGRYRGKNTIPAVSEAGGAAGEKYFSANIRAPPLHDKQGAAAVNNRR